MVWKIRAVQSCNIKVPSMTLALRLLARAWDVVKLNLEPIPIIIPTNHTVREICTVENVEEKL